MESSWRGSAERASLDLAMQIRLIVAGKPALAYAKLGVDEYLKRLSRGGNHELVILKAGNREEVSSRLLERSQGCFRIALDERGECLSTRKFAEKLDSLEMRGDIKTVAFLIGAADGHNTELREKSDLILTISPFTLQHELALLVLLEQLYRVASLKSGSPYHRD
jgi:23S rRNA (pseudouridine1915-N3)-methyltransferase